MRPAGALLLLFLLLPSAVAQSDAGPKLQAEAEKAQASGNDELAATLYARALQQNPAWTEGWWKYGGLLYEQRQFQAAAVAFARLTQLAPQNPLGYALLGLCEYEQSDWDNASLHLGKALNHGGLPPEIANASMYHYGLVLMHQHNRNGALIVFRLLQHVAPAYPNLVAAFGSAELNLTEIPSSEEANSAAVTLAGQAATAVLELRSADAERYYRQLVQQYPELPFAHLCLALFLQNSGRDAEAEEQFKAETKVNAVSPDPWVSMAQLALARRDASQTRAYAEEARKRNPKDGLCYLLEGRGYVLDQQWERALPLLQKAEALAPESYEVHYTLVSVYTALHEPQQATAERKLFADTFAATAHPDEKGIHP